MPCAFEYTTFVPGDGAFEEIIAWFTVRERIHVGDDEAFFGIDNKGVVVNRMERLLFVGHAHQLALIAFRGNRLIGRQGHTGGVLAGNMRVVTKR